mmetsp:Transcript_11461/g.24307  ORF Transcript_11461/g.24307 Transcript_11461/m.24307 type:complete len:296 (+) Transcript_11461:1051-1938(+)
MLARDERCSIFSVCSLQQVVGYHPPTFILSGQCLFLRCSVGVVSRKTERCCTFIVDGQRGTSTVLEHEYLRTHPKKKWTCFVLYHITSYCFSHETNKQIANHASRLLSDMGMTSGLSQSKMAGRGALGGFGNRSSAEDQRLRDYHEQTAREVADFLVPRLRKTGKGMMSLTDVYCLFNRARGTNLLSPEDLRDSCALLNEGLNVGLSQRTFPSGIVVLQLDDLALSATNYEARRKFIDLCTDENGKSALEASHSLQLSPLLAAEQLEEAERLGWLCRDATLSTVRFYPNKFVTTF